MDGKFLVVDKAILPWYYEKVVEARQLLEEEKVKDIGEAVRTVGISRSTFYKYKDYVTVLNAKGSKRAILSLMLRHEAGILARMIGIIASHSYSIWTINQSPPVNGQAAVVLALDMHEATGSLENLMRDMREMDGASKIHLIGIE